MTPNDPARWHKEICKVSGYLSVSIEKRVLGSASLRDYATRLERIANEMRTAAIQDAKSR